MGKNKVPRFYGPPRMYDENGGSNLRNTEKSSKVILDVEVTCTVK